MAHRVVGHQVQAIFVVVNEHAIDEHGFRITGDPAVDLGHADERSHEHPRDNGDGDGERDGD